MHFHKNLYLSLFGFLTCTLFGCSEFPFKNLPVLQTGNFDFKDTIDFVDTIKFGEKIQDSVSIVYYNECYRNCYFEEKKIEEYKYEFKLLYGLTTENCSGNPIIKSKIAFEFKPNTKGRFTLLLRDRNYTFTKILYVE